MDETVPLRRLAAALRAAARCVALTGAGVSTASGLPDFRSSGGLWKGANPLEVANAQALRRDPDAVWAFYRQRLSLLARAAPNPAHRALARLEAAGLVQAVVTQNVDGLHAAAGSAEVLEVHGSLERARCDACGAEPARPELERRLASAPGAPRCECGAVLRPGVVLFGDPLPGAAIDRAFELAAAADLLLVCGTSLEVHPVAGLADVTLRAGGELAILTTGPTPYDGAAAHRLHGPLDRLLPKLEQAAGQVPDARR